MTDHTHAWTWGPLDLYYREDKYGNRDWKGAALRYCECGEFECVGADRGQTPFQAAWLVESQAARVARSAKQRERNAMYKARREAAAKEDEA